VAFCAVLLVAGAVAQRRQFNKLLFNCCKASSHIIIMGSLKRKEGPNGASASKPPRTATESRPSKRAKASESTKDDGKKSAKEQKSPAKPAPAPVVSKLKEEEPLFPRGGGSVLTPLEQKQISIQAKKDVLFEEQSEGKKGDNSARRKRRKSRAAEAGTGESKDEDAVKVEGLNFKVGDDDRGKPRVMQRLTCAF
jgi:rRNA biogenesis protein RRP5